MYTYWHLYYNNYEHADREARSISRRDKCTSCVVTDSRFPNEWRVLIYTAQPGFMFGQTIVICYKNGDVTPSPSRCTRNVIVEFGCPNECDETLHAVRHHMYGHDHDFHHWKNSRPDIPELLDVLDRLNPTVIEIYERVRWPREMWRYFMTLCEKRRIVVLEVMPEIQYFWELTLIAQTQRGLSYRKSD